MALYQVWFSTKRRKWLLQGEVSESAMAQIREIAREKGIKLVEGQAIVDHVHLLLDLPHESELPRAMNLLKGGSARRLFLQFPELKMDAGVTNFWQAGYAKEPGSAHRSEPRSPLHSHAVGETRRL